jgi:DNA-binding GntR family transcriptional regulator
MPSPPSFEKSLTVRPANSADRAYFEIRQLAVGFKFRPDERVNEVQLARQLNVSRTPVREALNRLASEGFLVLKPNRGYFFRALDIGELLALSEVRSVLETGSFVLACQRAETDGINALEKFWIAAEKMYARHDVDEIVELDEKFHRQLALLSGNMALVEQIDLVAARVRFIRRTSIERGLNFPALVLDHVEIIKALADRNTAHGVSVLRRHIAITTEDAASAIKEALLRLYLPDTAPENVLST